MTTMIEIGSAVAARLCRGERGRRTAGRVSIHPGPIGELDQHDLDSAGAVGRRERRKIERTDPLSPGARSNRDRRDWRRAHAIAARPGSSFGARGGRDAGRILVQKAGFLRPVSRRPVRSGFDIELRSRVFRPGGAWSYPPAKPDFHWTACEGRFFTDPYIRRTAPTLGISRWSFGCVLRSIRSSIVRVTCRNFMPTSRTPISSASAA